jgi:hypothetical protein
MGPPQLTSTQLIRASLLVGLIVASTELLSCAGLKLTRNWPSGSFRAAYESHLRLVSPGPGGSFLPLLPHPYFGFQGDKAHFDYYNNYGFASAVDYPYERKSDEYVIGVLGGSVAESFALHVAENGYLSKLSTVVPQLRGKRIVVLNLAIAGAKQPQQFYIACYFTRMVDLLVNVDGFNDINSFDGRYPTDYPWHYHDLYGIGSSPTVDAMLLRGLHRVDRDLTKAAMAVPFIARSSSAYLLWLSTTQVLARVTAGLQTRQASARETTRPFNDPPREKDASVLDELADIWARYAILQDTVARKEGRRAVFFIQPNQYVQPAKSFSAEERAIALGDPQLADPANGTDAGYRRLRKKLEELKQIGISAFDLSAVFADVSEPTYKDSCCHLNELGERILADAIVKAVADDGGRALFDLGPSASLSRPVRR